MIGLIITAEPYHANTPLMRGLLPTPPVPTLSAALRELEHLVTLPPTDIEEQLLGIIGDADRSTWMLGRAIKTTHDGRNLILDRGWNSYPWPIANEEPGEIVGATHTPTRSCGPSATSKPGSHALELTTRRATKVGDSRRTSNLEPSDVGTSYPTLQLEAADRQQLPSPEAMRWN